MFFTSATIVTSAILFQGFPGSVTSIINIVLGFLVICCGVILLQLSKSAKDVPDAAIFKGDLDQVREVAEQQESETEPKADAIRGTAAIIRRLSNSRQKLEVEEVKRIQEEKRLDMMEPIGENEQVEWDGLRRRKTTISLPAHPAVNRRRTLHPPLGMSHFPEVEPTDRLTTSEDERGGAIDAGFAPRPRAAKSTLLPSQQRDPGRHNPHMHPIALTEISLPASQPTETPTTAHFSPAPPPAPFPKVWGLPSGLSRQQGNLDGPSDVPSTDSTYLVPAHAPSRNSAAPTPPPHTAKRQFSFQNVFHRHRQSSSGEAEHPHPPRTPRKSISSHQHPGAKNATEEERMGLVTGDSTSRVELPRYDSAGGEDDSDWQRLERTASPEGEEALPRGGEEKSGEEYEREYEMQRREWAQRHDPPEKGVKEWEGHRPPGGPGAFI